MNIDQVQRRDIDELGVNTISLAIDELSSVNESFISLLTSNLSANNWYSDDGSLAKDMVTNDDKLVFSLEPQTDWKYKDIVGIKLVGNIYSSDLISLESIGINQYFTSLDFPINQSTDVDVSLDISSISQEDLNSLIVDKGFDIVLNFNGNKTNASVSIIELQAVFVFDDKLQGEKEAILNRIDDVYYKPIITTHSDITDNRTLVHNTVEIGSRKIHSFRLKINFDITATTSWKTLDYSAFVERYGLTPFHQIQFTIADGRILFRLKSDKMIDYKSVTGSSITQTGSFWLEFNYMN